MKRPSAGSGFHKRRAPGRRQLVGWPDEVNGGIDSRDAERLRHAAHTLKGSLSNFPTGAARDTAARMETIGFDADFDAAREIVPTREKEIDRLRALLPTLI